MPVRRNLFNNIKQCINCKRPLPLEYTEEICPGCKDMLLFQEVKEFIRENDVNEYQVAERFNLPLKQVKAWIKEGRIEYKQTAEATISGLHCENCGAPISFGTLCPKCLRAATNTGHGYGLASSNSDKNKMRYVDGTNR